MIWHLAQSINIWTDKHIQNQSACLTSRRIDVAAPPAAGAAAASAAAAAAAAAARISFRSSMACFLGWGASRDGDPSRLLGLFLSLSSVFIPELGVGERQGGGFLV